MASKSSIYKDILREYDSIRDQNTYALRQRQKEVYQKCSRIEMIDQLVSQTGIRIARLILEKPDQSMLQLQNMKEELTELKVEKSGLLKRYGYSEDYLLPHYRCKKCKDTGFIEKEKCTCLQQKLVDRAYDQSNLKEIIKKENFDFFDFRYYSEIPNTSEGTSPRTNIQEIYNVCTRFVQNFDKTYANLFLYGNTGLGKTFLCNCIAKDLMDAGKTVLYRTAPQLFKIIEDARFNRSEEDEPVSYMNDILSVDLFIIDDLGTEFSTILSSSELFSIINTRLLEKKPVILSTNLSPAKLLDQYSDRVVSRIIGNYQALKFFGDDIRVKKKFKN